MILRYYRNSSSSAPISPVLCLSSWFLRNFAFLKTFWQMAQTSDLLVEWASLLWPTRLYSDKNFMLQWSQFNKLAASFEPVSWVWKKFKFIQVIGSCLWKPGLKKEAVPECASWGPLWCHIQYRRQCRTALSLDGTLSCDFSVPWPFWRLCRRMGIAPSSKQTKIGEPRCYF